MTQSKQTHSLANDQEENIDHSFNCYLAVKAAKANTKENLQIVALLYDCMKNLCTTMDRLDNLMESLIFCNEKEKGK